MRHHLLIASLVTLAIPGCVTPPGTPEVAPLADPECTRCDGANELPFAGADDLPDTSDLDGRKPWTVLVYFATHVGSNAKLAEAVREDLRSMRSVGAGPHANVVIQYHRPETGQVAGIEDVRLELPEAGELPGQAIDPDPIAGMKVLEKLGDTDQGSAQTLEDFVAWAVERYPARRYALILHGHGMAWQGFGIDANHMNHRIKLPELAAALDRARGRSLDAERFDLLMLDGCLMGTLEVAAELKSQARYLLSSEMVEVAAGQPYAQVLPFLTRHPRQSVERIMSNMAHAYVHSYSVEGGYLGPPLPTALTILGLDLDKLDALEQKLRTLADEVRASFGGLSGEQVQTVLDQQSMALADDGLHSADLYQVLHGLEEAPFSTDAVRAAAKDARDFIGYPRDGYNPAERAVTVTAPGDAQIIFGLDAWTRNEDLSGSVPPLKPRFDVRPLGIPVADENLRFRGMLLGGKQELTFHPFLPNVHEFDWVVASADGTKRLRVPGNVKRERDYYVSQSFQTRSPGSPFIVEGHTQGFYFRQSAMVHGLGAQPRATSTKAVSSAT